LRHVEPRASVLSRSSAIELRNAKGIPALWEKWCTTGKHGGGKRKKNAVLKCVKSGHVRGYFSDLPLQPELEHGHSMYPSFEHLNSPSDHQQAVVEARLINDMKSHLSSKFPDVQLVLAPLQVPSLLNGAQSAHHGLVLQLEVDEEHPAWIGVHPQPWHSTGNCMTKVEDLKGTRGRRSSACLGQ
jgi:hypothetical protein